jgi:flagellar basal body-associated protein FliL
MAEKAEKKPEAAPPAAAGHGDKKGGGGLLSKTPVLVGGAMVIEAVVLLVGIWIFKGSTPKTAQGADKIEGVTKNAEGEIVAAPDTDKKRPVEIPVADFRALNRRSGQTFLYDVSIVASTKAEYEEQVKKKIADRGNLIRDRIRTIIAESDPDKLGGGSEPGLETLRRQVKYQLDEIVGEGLIDEVLVPKCIPFRTDY